MLYCTVPNAPRTPNTEFPYEGRYKDNQYQGSDIDVDDKDYPVYRNEKANGYTLQFDKDTNNWLITVGGNVNVISRCTNGNSKDVRKCTKWETSSLYTNMGQPEVRKCYDVVQCREQEGDRRRRGLKNTRSILNQDLFNNATYIAKLHDWYLTLSKSGNIRNILCQGVDLKHISAEGNACVNGVPGQIPQHLTMAEKHEIDCDEKETQPVKPIPVRTQPPKINRRLPSPEEALAVARTSYLGRTYMTPKLRVVAGQMVMPEFHEFAEGIKVLLKNDIALKSKVMSSFHEHVRVYDEMVEFKQNAINKLWAANKNSPKNLEAIKLFAEEKTFTNNAVLTVNKATKELKFVKLATKGFKVLGGMGKMAMAGLRSLASVLEVFGPLMDALAFGFTIIAAFDTAMACNPIHKQQFEKSCREILNKPSNDGSYLYCQSLEPKIAKQCSEAKKELAKSIIGFIFPPVLIVDFFVNLFHTKKDTSWGYHNKNHQKDVSLCNEDRYAGIGIIKNHSEKTFETFMYDQLPTIVSPFLAMYFGKDNFNCNQCATDTILRDPKTNKELLDNPSDYNLCYTMCSKGKFKDVSYLDARTVNTVSVETNADGYFSYFCIKKEDASKNTITSLDSTSVSLAGGSKYSLQQERFSRCKHTNHGKDVICQYVSGDTKEIKFSFSVLDEGNETGYWSGHYDKGKRKTKMTYLTGGSFYETHNGGQRQLVTNLHNY
eukprot:Pgem_evm2s19814